MARSSAARTGASHIRFVMVEAETADGDLGQITQAIQNALRGPSPTVHRIAPAAIAKTIIQEPQDEVAPESDEEAQTDVTVEVPRSSRPRRAAPTPEVLELDLTTETSLASFAQQANPKNHWKRYLVIAAWFKEHRGLDAITPDHVYTCYRTLKWPLNMNDFAQPLRDLKAKQFLTSPEKGSYAINHLGLQEVQKLISGGE